MAAILRVRDENGNVIDISAIVGPRGPAGADGTDGSPGAAGYTPVKGTDYWTDADKTEMVNDVLAALPTWTGGSY